MNPFGESAGTMAQPSPSAIGIGAEKAPEPAPHAERIMELYRRVGELEAALNEAAQRIMRLERRVGD
jgi:hypothetical protein